MDFSKLSRAEWLGLVASALLVISVLFLPWFGLAHGPSREEVGGDGFLCGDFEYRCTGFQTFPILRWLLLAAASARGSSPGSSFAATSSRGLRES